MTDRLLLRIPEAAERLALSRAMLYELIARGELRVLHVGRAVRIPVDELQRWLDERLGAVRNERDA
jgi:excisionase family DNA binding protein